MYCLNHHAPFWLSLVYFWKMFTWFLYLKKKKRNINEDILFFVRSFISELPISLLCWGVSAFISYLGSLFFSHCYTSWIIDFSWHLYLVYLFFFFISHLKSVLCETIMFNWCLPVIQSVKESVLSVCISINHQPASHCFIPALKNLISWAI